MKKTKKWLVSALMIAFSATATFAITSCKDGDDSSDSGAGAHTHTYTDTVTAPTCTTEGYTTHTCACGDTYQDTQVPALGHKYNTNVTKYPTTTAAGEKIVTCKTCGASETKTIEALTFTMPKVADVLVGVIGAIDVSIEVDEGTYIFYDESYEVDMEGAAKCTTELAFSLGEVGINTADGLTAFMNIEVMFTEKYFDEQGAEMQSQVVGGDINCYVNGDDVSLEAVDLNGTTTLSQQINISEMAYMALAEATGMTYEQMVTMASVGSELMTYVPNVMQMVAGEMPMVTESYIQGAMSLLQSVGQDVIVSTEEGTNTKYSVDLTVLGQFVTAIKDETVSSYVDKVYGAGSMAALTKFAVDMPTMTIKDVANSAVAMAENYGIDVGNVYYLVNMLARQMGAADFDVEAAIEQYYDITLGSLIIAASGSEDMTVDGMKTMISEMVTMVVDLTVDDIYTMITGEEASFIEQAEALIASLPDMVTANMVFDAEGAFVSASFVCGEMDIQLAVNGGNLNATATINGTDVEFAIGESGFLYNVSMGEDVLANFEFLFDENNCTVDVVLNGEDFFDFSANYDNGTATVSVGVYGMEGGYYEEHYDAETGEYYDVYVEREVVKEAEIDATATLVDGTVTAATGTIDARTSEWDVDLNELVYTWEKVADFSYTNNNGSVIATMNAEDETLLELSNAKTETSNVFTMEVTDLQAGSDGTETEKIGEMIFGYETVEGVTEYFANQTNFDDGEEDPVFDVEVHVKDDRIVYYSFGAGSSHSGAHGHNNDYEVGGVQYRDCEIVNPDEWIEFTFTETENGAEWTIRTTYTETRTEYTEYYDETLEKWVRVDSSFKEATTTDTYGYDISVAFVEGVLTYNFSPVGEGGFGSTYIMNEMELILSEDSIKYVVYPTEEGEEANSIELNKIDNGVEFVITTAHSKPGSSLATETATITVSCTYVDGVFHIGYDIENFCLINLGYGYNYLEGEGGISISIS